MSQTEISDLLLNIFPEKDLFSISAYLKANCKFTVQDLNEKQC